VDRPDDVTRLRFEFEIPRNGGHGVSSGPGVFGYGIGAGGRNELCRNSIASMLFVELCSIQKAIMSI
jgi:hypothetical protein